MEEFEQELRKNDSRVHIKINSPELRIKLDLEVKYLISQFHYWNGNQPHSFVCWPCDSTASSVCTPGVNSWWQIVLVACFPTPSCKPFNGGFLD